MVRREVAGLCDLVVDVAARDSGEAAVADLQPLVRAARTLAGAADADPAGKVAF
jgi:predicted RNA-binding protein associated with RNAse of E/G family